MEINKSDFIKISSEPLHLENCIKLISCLEAGAISTFSGTTKNYFEGKKVLKLEYEAYISMAEKEIKKICEKIRNKWNVINILIYHRIGIVPVGETSVIIAISSIHRIDSLEAVHFAIDELKATVPIWKKEIYEDNSISWKDNQECLHHHQNLSSLLK